MYYHRLDNSYARAIGKQARAYVEKITHGTSSAKTIIEHLKQVVD